MFLDSETFLNQATTFLFIVSTLCEVLSPPMNILFVRSEVNVESQKCHAQSSAKCFSERPIKASRWSVVKLHVKFFR